jgi:hypothetical protein
MVIVTSHVFIGYIVRKTISYENMIVVLQIVINDAFIVEDRIVCRMTCMTASKLNTQCHL